MKTRYIIGALIICAVTSLYLRIVLPYGNVFTGEWIKFTSIDAYWQMSQVDKLTPRFPELFTQLSHTGFGRTPFFIWVLSGIIWCVGLGSPTQQTIDTVGAYFPAIIGVVTIIPVYFIGKTMFNRGVGVMAAAMIAILPGEWLGRSSLGFADHHVMEVLLSTFALMFLIMAFKAEGKKGYIYAAVSILILGFYLLTWTGGVLFVLIIVAFLCAQVVVNLFHRRDVVRYMGLLVLISIVGVLAINMVEIGGGMFSIFSGPTQTTTSELQRLTFASAWGNFWFGVVLIPIALICLIRHTIKSGDNGAVLLIVWSVTTLILMMMFRRFAYYFAVNTALLTGWFVWYIWQWLKGKKSIGAELVAVGVIALMIMPNVMMSIAAAKHTPFAPSDAWCETLEWIDGNTPETIDWWAFGTQEPVSNYILAWWDYGYWIERMADRKAYVDPGQDNARISEVAKGLLSPAWDTSPGDYLILDYLTVYGRRGAIEIWAGYRPMNYNDTLMVKLYAGGAVDGWERVYESEQKVNGVSEVKVFKLCE